MTRARPQAAVAVDSKSGAGSFEHRMHGYMLRTLSEDLPKGRALELGCFEGEFTKRLAAIYEDLTVVEGASELIGMAKARAPAHVDFIVSRFEEFAPKGQFDAIFLVHTLEHTPDPVALLKRIRGWLSEQGRLFVLVPNGNAASRQIAEEVSGPAKTTARRSYNLSTLKGHITDAGLFAIKSGGVFFKTFSASRLDGMMEAGAIDQDYLEGCFQLGKRYPDLCASIYAICEPWSGKPYSRRGSR